MVIARAGYEEGDEAVLLQLQRDGHATIQALCASTGVTATAVRHRLKRLQDLGFVQRAVIRAERGRPYHAYQLTTAGVHSLGDNYGELAQLLWDELRQIEELNVRTRVLGRIEAQLATRYASRVTGKSVTERMRELQVVLSERGFRVEVTEDSGLPILREQHCPYHELATADAQVCQMEQRVFEQVLGTPLHLAKSCREGHGCCEFQVAETPSTETVPFRGFAGDTTITVS